MSTPKKSDPLTLDEVTEASEKFFPLFTVVQDKMPKGSTCEDTLKCMEAVAKLAHKQRAEKREKDAKIFGFNKNA
jgi:hypothetical protein